MKPLSWLSEGCPHRSDLRASIYVLVFSAYKDMNHSGLEPNDLILTFISSGASIVA